MVAQDLFPGGKSWSEALLERRKTHSCRTDGQPVPALAESGVLNDRRRNTTRKAKNVHGAATAAAAARGNMVHVHGMPVN